MESIISLISVVATLIGVVLFYKKQQDKLQAEIKLRETKAKDQALLEQELEVAKAIAELDKNIQKLKEKKEAEARKRAEDNLSLKERAERIKKRLK